MQVTKYNQHSNYYIILGHSQIKIGSFHGPLNYYRHIFQYGDSNDKPAKTRVPVLQLWGEGDKYLHIDTARGSKKYVDDFEEEYFGGVSHWIMQEVPTQVNEAMEKYLKARK